MMTVVTAVCSRSCVPQPIFHARKVDSIPSSSSDAPTGVRYCTDRPPNFPPSLSTPKSDFRGVVHPNFFTECRPGLHFSLSLTIACDRVSTHSTDSDLARSKRTFFLRFFEAQPATSSSYFSMTFFPFFHFYFCTDTLDLATTAHSLYSSTHFERNCAHGF